MPEHSPPKRQRPKWACVIHDLGDDLGWAISAWCDFPRPARRFGAAIATAITAHAFGAPEVVDSIVYMFLN